MTQTNTTQNKEELSKEVKKFRERYEDFIGIKKGEHIFKIHSDYFDAIAPFWLEELSQAHQSGIEEERKRIAKTMDRFEKINKKDNDRIGGWSWLKTTLKENK